MCGIVGYVGKRDIVSVLLVGLERLSYRGYDSSGIATLSDGELSVWKKAGKLHELAHVLKPLSIKGPIGIGHTRWATHGIPNEANAHPHISQDKKVAVVHNGIIENYLEIKTRLVKKGRIFRSETDTEVIVHLIDQYLNGGSVTLEAAVEKAAQDLVGSYAMAVIAEKNPDEIVVCRQGSPLILGLGKNENYISSDINAIITHTKDVIYLDDGEMAVVKQHSIQVRKMGGDVIEKPVQHIKWDSTASEKGGYAHYMLKEIHEQPSIVRNIISKALNEDGMPHFPKVQMQNQELARVSRFLIQACGTSWHAGVFAKYLLEQYARIPTEIDISSEFRYRQMITEGNEIVVGISQSGETADTLACIREAKSKFFKVLSFVNVQGSSMDRESDAVIYTHAGQEIGVASTKNYVAQLVNIYLFVIYLGLLRWTIDAEKAKEMVAALKRIPEYLEKILSQEETIKQLAKKYHGAKEFLFIGRSVNYPSALEGALKLKEISYIHATGYAAGELKHGPIALIDEELPIVCLAPKSETYDKMVSNIQEVRARKGRTIILATEGDTTISQLAEDIIYIPDVPEDLTPILIAVPLQLLAYYIAIELGCDVDQPRNLAKSVTVE